MVIHEVGLIFRGYVLVHVFNRSVKHISKNNRSSLLSAIMTFAQTAFSSNKIEYLEVNKYIIAVSEDNITSQDYMVPESLIGYVVLEKKEKKPDKYLRKVIRPLLKQSTKLFKAEFDGKYLAEITQFKEFKVKLYEIFGLKKKQSKKKLIFPLN